MAAIETMDGSRKVTVERGLIGNEEVVFVQVTSEKLVPSYQLLTFAAEAWDKHVAGAK